MDWVVFGDDYGAHPSTTQHLVNALPDAHRVVWVNSLGMRAPTLTRGDLSRAVAKLRRRRHPSRAAAAPAARVPTVVDVVEPHVVPWHHDPRARAINGFRLARQLRDVLARHEMNDAVNVLAANPIAHLYRDSLSFRRWAYLRLDDYAELPGVDSSLVGAVEPDAIASADITFATARPLLPPGGRYLPQGVDAAHFGLASPAPVGARRLGFFGLVERWIDVPLITAIARRNPDWTIEIVGRVAHGKDALLAEPNILLRGPVDYRLLPEAIGTWSAAFAPFVVDDLTRAVNPLKVREYLSAGLPVWSTPLPEVAALRPWVTLGETADDASAWLSSLTDDGQKVSDRKREMAGHGWGARAAEVCRALA